MAANLLLDAARRLAALGLRVHPLAGKLPRLRAWPQLASADPAVLAGWWAQWPTADVGVATGPESGVVVLDLDPAHGGTASLAELTAAHGALPPTWEVHTGGGGRHYYFRYPAGATVGNSAGKVGRGLDVRGVHGYVVAPPSRHATGTCYRWVVAPDAGPPADLPPWLLARMGQPHPPGPPLLSGEGGDRTVTVRDSAPRPQPDLPPLRLGEGGDRTVTVRDSAPRPQPDLPPLRLGEGGRGGEVASARYAQAALRGEADAVAQAAPGARNARLNKAAFRLGGFVASGALSEAEVVQALSAAATAAGLPAAEVAATVRSGLAAGAHGGDQPRRSSLTERAAGFIPAVSAPAVCLADVAPQPVRWLWEGRIPYGMITLMDGDPGLGKSFVTLDLAARVSTGRPMPLAAAPGGDPAAVVLLNAEDDLACTVAPRLVALGADRRRVHTLPAVADAAGVERAPQLAEDLDAIEAVVAKVAAKLVVIDPLMAYLGGRVDSHRDADVRRVLHRLKGLAERTGAAVVVVRHLNKAAEVGNPLYRGGGSIGIIGAARSALLVGAHPEAEGVRVLARSKSNVAAPVPSLAYRLDAAAGGAVVTWLGETPVSAQDLLAKKKEASGPAPAARDEAAAWLRAYLADGPRPAKDVWAAAEAAGLAQGTVKRAKGTAGIEAVKTAEGWFWQLPGQGAQVPGPGGEPAPLDPLDPLATPARLQGGQEDQGDQVAQVPEALPLVSPLPALPPGAVPAYDCATWEDAEAVLRHHLKHAAPSPERPPDGHLFDGDDPLGPLRR